MTLQLQAPSFGASISSFVSPLRRSTHRFVIRAKAEPTDKSVEIMRKFSEQYARKSGTYFCVDKGVTSVVIKGLADHKDSLGAPLCPCRHYDDKPAEAGQGFWNCPCVPMRERKECHCMLFLTPENDFAGKEQVVERGGGSVSDSAKLRGDRGFGSGSKRSMGDRLGSNARGFSFSATKRQRGDGIKWSGGDNTLHDSRISRNDLRLKLLRKRSFKKNGGVVAERKQMVPRAKLSKPVHSAVRYQVPQKKSETNRSSFLRQIPPRESAADLYQENSLRNFNSSQSREGFRARSPDIFLNTSFRPSPQRNFGELHSASSFRSVDAPRAGQFLRNGMVSSSQPTDSLRFTMKSTPQTAKPVGQLVPTNYSMQKVSYMGEEPPTVAGLLHRLGLVKYAITFQAEEIDMTALKQMGDKDLKELGIPMGPRKKILLALLARGKRQPP